MKMWNFINEILAAFKPCFSRRASWCWFCTIIIGLMLRSDTLGITSIIRDLSLTPKVYESMIHFFRASSWSLFSLMQMWIRTVKQYAPLYQSSDSVILIGDGVKQAKEANFMPGVKKLHQESENSSKADYIFGHMFGSIGILAGNPDKWFCMPLFTNLQDGVKTILHWENPALRQESHVVEMIKNAFRVTEVIEHKSLLLLDRYFLSTAALSKLNELCTSSSRFSMHIITKAKKSCIAYETPDNPANKRGRKCKKGNRVKLQELFESKKDAFETTKITLYGKMETIRYYCVDLLWGQKLYQKLRFVLVELNGNCVIFATTDVTIDPLEVVRLYSYRFKIECTFRELKQVIGGFSYQFWTKAMPKLERYLKKGDIQPLELVKDKALRRRILQTLKAIECYVMCSTIAIGILQIISIKYSKEIKSSKLRYLRTPSKKLVSEATVSWFLGKNVFRIMAQNPSIPITKIIRSKQEPSALSAFFKAS